MRWIIAITLLLGGCVTSNSLGTSAESQTNVNRLSKLSIGMSEAEVLQIMKRPKSQETYDLKGDIYDVWFYVTQPTTLGQKKLVSANLTPLNFKNGYLAAIGNEYYRWIVKQNQILADEMNGPAQKTPPVQLEDEDLEKALQAPQNGTPIAPAKPGTPVKPAPKQKPVSMSSRPKQEESTEESKPEKNKTPMTEEDTEMLDEESDQNFNFW